MIDVIVSKIGSGRYIQGSGALACIGKEAQRFGKKAFLIGGGRALNAAFPSIEKSFQKYGIVFDVKTNKGFCSYENMDFFCSEASSKSADMIIGVGGGKSIDLSKAVAAKLGIPIITVPTIAATCAAWTPLSIMYSQDGKPKGPLYHEYEINCVIVDLDILAKAPVRTLASGIADSFAKSEEITNGEPGRNLDNTDVRVHTSYRLAKVIDEILYHSALDAYNDCKNNNASKTLSDIIYANIAITGACSGFASGSNQLAIAHTFNNALRKGFTEQINEFYHGEVVGVGLIVQMYYNNSPNINSYKSICVSLNLPINLKQLNIMPSGEIYDYVLKYVVDKMQINTDIAGIQRIKDGLIDIFK
jgi:glycerol dehydrogenase-like iron-containing ADH family enzyme